MHNIHQNMHTSQAYIAVSFVCVCMIALSQHIYRNEDGKIIQTYKAPSTPIETYFTLTEVCQTGIINAWHYYNLVGAKL
jgi:hypothetical protein